MWNCPFHLAGIQDSITNRIQATAIIQTHGDSMEAALSKLVILVLGVLVAPGPTTDEGIGALPSGDMVVPLDNGGSTAVGKVVDPGNTGGTAPMGGTTGIGGTPVTSGAVETNGGAAIVDPGTIVPNPAAAGGTIGLTG